MKDPLRTNEELLKEVSVLRHKIQELEQSEAGWKRPEDALQEREDRYRTILENIEEGYSEVDIAGNLTFFNDSVCRMIGYTRDELMGMNNRQYTDKKNSQILYQVFNKVFRTGEPSKGVDYEIIGKDGIKLYIESSVSLIRSICGQPIGFRGIIRNITERKRMEEALRESEEKYRVLFEGINDAVFVNDFGEDGLSGRFLQVNDIACRRLGYTREELLSLTPRDITIPDEYERIADKRIGLASHGDILVETIHVTKDGRKIPVESNIRQLKYLGRQVALSISRDITDRKQAEEYREMRQEVLSILNDPEDSPDSMQRVLTVLKARTGCSAVAIRLQEGKDFPYFAQEGFATDFLQTENMLISRAADGQMCRDKEGNVRLECTCGLVIDGRTAPSSPFFTRGGSFWTNDSFPLLDLPSDQDPRHHPRNQCIHQGYASFALVPLRNKDKAIGLIQFNDRRKGHFTLETVEHLEKIAAHIGAALIRRQGEEALQEAYDLLEQRVEERTKQLRKSEQRLQLAIEAADVAIGEFNVASNRFTWDETMCRFYGIPSDKLGGSYAAWEAMIHPEDRPLVREAFQRAVQGDQEFDREFRIVWSDGSIHWLKTNTAIERDSEGRPMRVIDTTLDVTADKLLVEAAEAASRAKSLFIGNMSHELRTPLSGVLGMTEALLNTPVTQQQRDYAETIRKSGKALLAVVSDILDFSKIEAGKMTLNSAPFLVESVIANVVNLFGPSAAEEKIGLHTTMDSEIPVLRGDTHRLTQVVNNLVGNAIKFTKKGEIQVTAKILRRTETEAELAIGVQDTGIGMTEEELSRIFTGFTQGDTTRGRRFGGTGLGLTISRNLVELMGGTLQVESVFGKGSLFTVLVTFPIAQGFAVSDLQFLQRSAPSAPINPAPPVTPPKPERLPGDMAELHALLEQLKEPLDNGEPLPCKEILAILLAKNWPKEQETLLAELDRLVKRYRLQDALDLLNNGAAG